MATQLGYETRPALKADYDRIADVLYIALGPSVPDEGEDVPRGIILRYALHADRRPTGATVVGVVHNQWDCDLDQLARVLAKHLDAPFRDIRAAIKSALGG